MMSANQMCQYLPANVVCQCHRCRKFYDIEYVIDVEATVAGGCWLLLAGWTDGWMAGGCWRVVGGCWMLLARTIRGLRLFAGCGWPEAFTPCWYLSIRPTKKEKKGERRGKRGKRGEEEEGKKEDRMG